MQLLSDTRTGRRQRLSFSYQLPNQGRRNQGGKGELESPPPQVPSRLVFKVLRKKSLLRTVPSGANLAKFDLTFTHPNPINGINSWMISWTIIWQILMKL